jgi:transcriptional regulator with XRE-family HTH domain
MPATKRIRPRDETFSERFARLRKARGLSQRALAKQIGISQRVVAYYESESERPPAHLLTDLARVLEVTTDDLLGLTKSEAAPFEADVRVWKRLQKIQKMPPRTRKTVLRLVDSVIASYSKGDAA